MWLNTRYDNVILLVFFLNLYGDHMRNNSHVLLRRFQQFRPTNVVEKVLCGCHTATTGEATFNLRGWLGATDRRRI